ncbi:hypothetical protein Goshw_002663 [Gossypium schwendimanii]|uniref:non-specific serine/threonine protein kinase n=1 Tax=Gossypium schwendimanii TaxID=34291 RepID=A0A7J9L0L8_GOSSC|nr:hypothetical protein [Gossypium schwendimanii]
MWRFKPFLQKEPAGLEGRTLDVANLKLHVRNVIAEGGFSCVYLAKDALHASKQYALKHIICNDQESLELVVKEISVLKSLQGHPNVITLYAHTILDMGRTKEALLVMEFCDKSLVNFLETRGTAYFEEKQILTIFLHICNAVFAMHCQSPPIAHRDLKAENILLGSDGLWKLCDFGSTSTNHKRFEKPEEMGIEEDNIRKHTTPAYRAPEMWDLFRRELINEKVDIWALGCLLFRICYFKNAFDGESKLQILNGNYRIPDLPKYSSSITNLIKDMLQASPVDRPDITQASTLLDWSFILEFRLVWFRVNEQLPAALQKSLPDRPPEMPSTEGVPRSSNRSPQMPSRSPPSPPVGEPAKTSPQPGLRASGGQLGAFWSTQHAKDADVAEEKSRPKYDEDPTSYSSVKHKRSPIRGETVQTHSPARSTPDKSHKPEDGLSKDIEINFFENKDTTTSFQDEAFNTFVAEFDSNKISSGIINKNTGKEKALEAEIVRLKEQLKQSNLEKAEMTSKFEKLSAICRSQRQEIQELKQTLAARTPSPNKSTSRYHNSPGSLGEKVEGTFSEFAQEKAGNWKTASPEAKPWQAFPEDAKPQQQQPLSKDNVHSVRTRNGHSNMHAAQATFGMETWGFGADNFTAAPTASSQRLKSMINEGSSSQRESKIKESNPVSQPAGWAGF